MPDDAHLPGVFPPTDDAGEADLPLSLGVKGRGRPRFHTRQTTFRQLEIFREVAERRSITAAAHALFLAQPTVSTQLAKLEAALGLHLTEQIGRQLHLTAAGEELLAGVRELFSVMDRLENRLARLSGLTTGVLRLGAVTTSKYLVPTWLGPFARRYPEVEIAFNIANRDELIQRLQANQDDLYFFSQPPTHLDIVARPVADNALVVIAPPDHALAGVADLTWNDLAGESLIVREPGSGTRQAIEQHFAKQGWAFRPRITIASNEAIKEAVAAGMGIAILSRHTLRHTSAAGLIELPVAHFPILSHWYLVHWRSKALAPAAEAFIDLIGQGANDLRIPPHRPVASAFEDRLRGAQALAQAGQGGIEIGADLAFAQALKET